MGTSEIISEINKLPVNQRLAPIELTLKKIREDEKKERLSLAVDMVLNDYLNDKELTAFTSIDQDGFYEDALASSLPNK